MRLYNKIQVLKVLNDHLGVYPTPVNLNWSWGWGSLSGILLGSQIVTGILLAMHYVGHVDHAFASVQHLMVDVPSGIILRYAHANGASLFFTVMYLHVLRGIYYSSGNQPREIVWISGVIIMLLMIITAFIGSLCSQKWIYNDNCYFETILLYSNILLLNKNFLTSENSLTKKIQIVKKYINLHLIETQELIAKENARKSGIYMILNLKNLNSYVGSASSNRINVRFRTHCINWGHSIILTKAIKKYGLNSFCFCILEYYPGFVLKEDLRKNHIDLLKLETSYLALIKPEYNILTIGGSSLGFKHTQETKNKMSESHLGFKHIQKTKNKILEYRQLLYKDLTLKEKALLNNHLNVKSTSVDLVNEKGEFINKFESISEAARVFKCSRSTIGRYLAEPTHCFKKVGFFRNSKK